MVVLFCLVFGVSTLSTCIIWTNRDGLFFIQNSVCVPLIKIIPYFWD